MLNTPFPDWPSFTRAETAAVARVLRSNRVNYWTGDECLKFQEEYARWAGVSHAIALNNGTVALEAALHALGIGPRDEVIVTPRSFMASASCVVFVGAVPVFADVDRDTQNLSAETIAPLITKRTRAILAVHLAGMPCDMDGIMALARQHRLSVVEDCAQAHGARYRGRMVGSFGDISAWSFCQDKIITTGGEGGMITTNDRRLWSKAWSYKDHGKNPQAQQREATGRRVLPDAGFRWVHDSFGTNGRMLEMQAAIGRQQLRTVDRWVRQRQAHAEAIWTVARELPGLRVPAAPSWAEHAAYRAYVFVEPRALSAQWSRDRIMTAINELGVPCRPGSCPEIYQESAFDRTGWRPAKPLPVARELGATGLCFLVHPTLKRRHIEKTCDALRAVMRKAVR